ncbi:Serine/threonine-protein phosphatase Pgam5, mitochondrial, partial [Hondaea fermentalgiana]
REEAAGEAEAAIRASKWRLPQTVILLRHGESLGNVRENAYRVIPDWCIPLTEEGKMQARRASKDIVELIGSRKVVIYYSPYTRAVETLDVLLDAIPEDQIAFMQEEPRIREQEFANFQTPQMPQIKKERNRYGRFFYRFPDGESGADVYDRVSSFFETLFRQFKRSPVSDMESDKDYVLLLVSHGLTIRLFVMKFLGFNVSYFEKLRNPRNCTPLVMRRKLGTFVYELDAASWRSMGVLNPYEQCVPIDSFQFPVHYCVSPSLKSFRSAHRKAFGNWSENGIQDDEDDVFDSSGDEFH